MGRHVPLAIFSSYVSDDEKARIVARLSGTPRKPIPLGKPAFPVVLPGMELPDFINFESWLIFDLIETDNSWIWQNPPWDGHEGYEKVKEIVLSMCGVNDPAERLCGLAKKYQNKGPADKKAREGMFCNVFLDQKKFPNVDRSTLFK